MTKEEFRKDFIKKFIKYNIDVCNSLINELPKSKYKSFKNTIFTFKFMLENIDIINSDIEQVQFINNCINKINSKYILCVKKKSE